jgi:UDP-2,3-diacylglucosamine hydrolase
MNHSLFISDLHLCDSRPHITTAFIDFLENIASQAQALYILGDLFEYWAGDDSIQYNAIQNNAIQNNVIETASLQPQGLSPQNIPAEAGYSCLKASIHALSSLAKTTPVFFMAGNRDFLIGKIFEKTTGITILPDPTLLNLYGKRVLLSHGDALCTDDTAYQNFRKQVRSADWQSQFLSQPLTTRVAYIEQLREKSERAKSAKSMQIMDVNSVAVEDLLKQHDYPPLFIHGHTHRPNTHTYTLAGHTCERWVLGDWYEQGSYLILDADGCHATNL